MQFLGLLLYDHHRTVADTNSRSSLSFCRAVGIHRGCPMPVPSSSSHRGRTASLAAAPGLVGSCPLMHRQCFYLKCHYLHPMHTFWKLTQACLCHCAAGVACTKSTIHLLGQVPTPGSKYRLNSKTLQAEVVMFYHITPKRLMQ